MDVVFSVEHLTQITATETKSEGIFFDVRNTLRTSLGKSFCDMNKTGVMSFSTSVINVCISYIISLEKFNMKINIMERRSQCIPVLNMHGSDQSTQGSLSCRLLI